MERYKELRTDLKTILAAMKIQLDGMKAAPKIEWSVNKSVKRRCWFVLGGERRQEITKEAVETWLAEE